MSLTFHANPRLSRDTTESRPPSRCKANYQITETLPMIPMGNRQTERKKFAEFFRKRGLEEKERFN